MSYDELPKDIKTMIKYYVEQEKCYVCKDEQVSKKCFNCEKKICLQCYTLDEDYDIPVTVILCKFCWKKNYPTVSWKDRYDAQEGYYSGYY